MHHKNAVRDDQPCACTALRKASRALTRVYDEALAGNGMTIVQFSVLRNLAREGALPLMQLAELLVMERTTLYRTLAPLERHGWVAVSDAQGRSKSATLTAQGRKAMQAATGAWAAVQQRLLESLGLSDWTTMEGSLARLLSVSRQLPA